MVTLWIRFKESLDLLTKDPLFISSVNPLEVSTHKFHSLAFPKPFHLHLHTFNTHLFFPSGCSSVLCSSKRHLHWFLAHHTRTRKRERKEKWKGRERKWKKRIPFLPCITYWHHFISYAHHDSLGNNWPFFLSHSQSLSLSFSFSVSFSFFLRLSFSLSLSHSWFLFSKLFFHPFMLASIFSYLIFLPYSFLLIHLSLTVTPLTHPFQI